MTLEEVERIIRDTKVSSLTANSGDLIRNMLEEIYYEGYCDGYTHVQRIVAMHYPRIFGCSNKEFFDENMDKIHRRLNAILDFEKESNKSDS